MPPRGKKPGFKVGRHKLPYWIARQVVRDTMGFPDSCIPLPPGASEDELAALCREHSARLFAWIDEHKDSENDQPQLTTRYDGSVFAACRIYQEHPYSPFHKVKANTRKTYVDSLKIIEADVGRRLIRKLTIFDVQHWYDQWRKPVVAVDEDGNSLAGAERVDRAHNAVAMFRTVLWFNAGLKRAECRELALELKTVKFERGGAREEELTYAQAVAFIRTALDLGRRGVMPRERARYMALGVAAQFELMLRQADIIGQWSKTRLGTKHPAGQHTIEVADETWAGFFTWENIPAWRWRMKTSKSKYRAPAEFDLSIYPLLFPLLEDVPHAQRTGAVVKGEHGLPVRYRSYANWFRQIARAAQIPDAVWSMDARAGGATEAEEAGADLDAIRESLTHRKESTTLRYVRRRSAKIASVQEARNAKRTADQGGGDGA